MNVLSKLLDAAVLHEVSSYHPKCKKVNLTHLCFANDLLIFTKGNLSSVKGIQNVLKIVYSFLGLQLNCAKSKIFLQVLAEIHFKRYSRRLVSS